MRLYEAMYIVDAELTEEQYTPIIEKYKKIVTDMGGVIVNAGKWEHGRRRLAYEIAGRREGMYILMRFEGDTTIPAELDRVFKISDDVFRHMVVRPDSNEEPPAPPVVVAPAVEVAPAPAPAPEPEPIVEPAPAEEPEADAAPEE